MINEDLPGFGDDLFDDIDLFYEPYTAQIQGLIDESLTITREEEASLSSMAIKPLTEAIAATIDLENFAQSQVTGFLDEAYYLTQDEIKEKADKIVSTVLSEQEELSRVKKLLDESVDRELFTYEKEAIDHSLHPHHTISEDIGSSLDEGDSVRVGHGKIVADTVVNVLKEAHDVYEYAGEKMVDAVLYPVKLAGDLLAKGVDSSARWIGNEIKDAFNNWLVNTGSSFEPDLQERLSPLIENVEKAFQNIRLDDSEGDVDDEIGASIENLTAPGLFPLGAFGGAMAMFAVPMILSAITTTIVQPWLSKGQQWGNRLARPLHLSPAEIIKAWDALGKPLTDLEFELSSHGFKNKDQEFLKRLNKTQPSIFELVSWLNWEKISEAEFKTALENYGFDDRWVKAFEETRYPFPPVSDLIRFSVRDVYTPEVVDRFDLFAELPAEFVRQSKLAGLDPEYAKLYWGAHWVIPSFGQGTEMLRRTTDIDNPEADGDPVFYKGEEIAKTWLSTADMNTLQTTLDQLPWFKSRYRAIQQKPFTRVDVRRMNKLVSQKTGQPILDEKAVYLAYRDLGYSEDKATTLTEFVLEYNKERVKIDKKTERDLTLTQLLGLYHDGLIVDNISNMVSGLGYSPKETDLLVDRARLKRAAAELKEELALIEQQRVFGGASEEETMVALGKLALPASAQTEFLAKIQRKLKTTKVKLLSKGDLDSLLLDDVIPPEEYRKQMGLLGYSVEQIDWLESLVIKRLSVAQATKLYVQGTIELDELTEELEFKGFAPRDVDRLLEQAVEKRTSENLAASEKLRKQKEEQERVEALGEEYEDWSSISQGVISRLYIEDTIDKDTLKLALQAKGYSPRMVGLLTDSLTLRKEAEDD